MHPAIAIGNIAKISYSFANPALRTAVEMALMAVSRELSSIVRLPVAPCTLRCSCSTKRVSVIVSTSTSGSTDIVLRLSLIRLLEILTLYTESQCEDGPIQAGKNSGPAACMRSLRCSL